MSNPESWEQPQPQPQPSRGVSSFSGNLPPLPPIYANNNDKHNFKPIGQPLGDDRKYPFPSLPSLPAFNGNRTLYGSGPPPVNPANPTNPPNSTNPPNKWTPWNYNKTQPFHSSFPSTEKPVENSSNSNSNNNSTTTTSASTTTPATSSTAGSGPAPSSTTTSSYKPLNVRDALFYLDLVKAQFESRPDVYNHFLDVMKDFKSQLIDTPGVIDRVSVLFKGHPRLMRGFNTFLPPGYNIECSDDPNDPTPIKVTTPSGATVLPLASGHGLDWKRPPPVYSDINGLESQESKDRKYEQNYKRSAVNEPVEAPLANQAYGVGKATQQEQPQQQSSITDLQEAAYKGISEYPRAATFTETPAASTAVAATEKKNSTPIEFNHAISYVNKIKNRYSNSPDIYKKFLEILQTYQREQKPISDVYTEVTLLFQDAPDLLDDFKQFLPDTTGEAQAAEAQVAAQNQAQLPPVGNFSPPAAGGAKGKDNQSNAANGNNNRVDIQTSSARDEPQPPRRKLIDDISSTLVPGIPEPIEPANKASNLVEEITFFDKVKKAIGSKQTYNEFLKILNLFNQDLIDKDTLVERVEGFIGAYPDLFEWFKSFIGFDESPYYIENITFKKHQLDLLLCKPYGPSYRKLPKVETLMPCSGRDDMCWEVLNDEWVGHPTWASEDSGFIAHRKNQYEETLFKIEEERHEYDFYMESNLRTIQTLETIANRIANMTNEEKESFKLTDGLGHTSQTIYKKVVRKVYGKEKGFEVIDALHTKPAIAVPIVLKRLKQKDEEWRKSHREWNKVWREMEQKVFFKSLDHMGLTFKQTDKKLLTSKQLVSEISTIKSEQTNKRLHPLTPKPQKQLDYDFHDHEVLFDIIKFVHVYAIAQGPYSIADREKIVEFIKFFVSLFFSIDQGEIEDALAKRIQQAEEKLQSIANNAPAVDSTPSTAASESEESSPAVSASNGRKRHRDTDLLKDVLKRVKQSKTDKEESESKSFEGEENHDQVEDDKAETDSVTTPWINSDAEKKENSDREMFNLFGNTNIYLFFRHLRVLYDRLLEAKKLNAEVTADIQGRNEVQFAKDLNLVNNQLAEMGLEFVKEDAYSQLLALCEKSIEGELDHQWFEESLRQAYRNRAFKLYTIDKVMQAFVKHLHTVITDTRTAEIMYLFQADRRAETTSATDQIVYRTKVRNQMNQDDNMFRIEFDKANEHVCIQFIAHDDLTLQDQKTEKEKWDYYMTTYVISHPTEGVDSSEMNPPFINETQFSSVEDEDVQAYTRPELKIKIQPENYKLFFETGSSDEFTKHSVYTKPVASEDSQQEKRLKMFKKGVDQQFISTFYNQEGEEQLSEEAATEKLSKLDNTLELLKSSPEEYQKAIEKAKNVTTTVKPSTDESEVTKDEDQDRTIEKGDDTIAADSTQINAADSLSKKKSLTERVLEQSGDLTVDADSTLAQDESTSEIPAVQSIGTESTEVKAVEENEAKKSADAEGDVKMDGIHED